MLDPARTNVSSTFLDPLEMSGTRVLTSAAEAHNQLGKVEKHGHLFEVVLKAVIDQVQPKDREEFGQCVLAACNSKKHDMVNSTGLSPAQHVFGRNPRIAVIVCRMNQIRWPEPVLCLMPRLPELKQCAQLLGWQ